MGKQNVAKVIAAKKEYDKALRRHDAAQAANPGRQVSSRELDNALRAWGDAREAASREENDLANRIID